jgi:FkbM family methyltransferase
MPSTPRGLNDRLVPQIKRALARQPRAYAWAHRVRVLGRFVRRRPHEPDFRAFALFRNDRSGLFLDIGANRGQSALSFRLFHPTAPILSIEANPTLEPDLRLIKRLLRNFDYMICAAAEENGTIELHVPVYRGLPVTGEASIDARAAQHGYWLEQQSISDAGDEVRLLRIEVVARRLDDLGLAPSFVKVDVEGAELRALTGLSRTIEAHRPILLLERSAAHDEVAAFLSDRAYEPFVYLPHEHRLMPYTGQEVQNVFYLPSS